MTTPGMVASVKWIGDRRYLWMLSALTITLPIVVAVLALATDWHPLWWAGSFIVFTITPLLDFLTGDDPNNPPEGVVPTLEKQCYHRHIAYPTTIVLYVSFAASMWVLCTNDLVWYDYIMFAFSVGVVTGISINTAHEPGHKTDGFERWLAKITLAPVAYGHSLTERNRGHHVRVVTPADPASAHYGESFWEFLPRTVVGSVKSAWALEKRRLEQQGHLVWSWRNDVFNAWAMTVVLWGVCIVSVGLKVVSLLIVQAAYGASLLEVANHLEHYGLCRQQLSSGRYERCTPQRSWNSNHVVTNLFLYQLQRHADHHANPTRSLQALRHFEYSPQLSVGYATMIPTAYVPPLWFRVMNPRMVAHYNSNMSLANIKSSIRDKVLAQYPACA